MVESCFGSVMTMDFMSICLAIIGLVVTVVGVVMPTASARQKIAFLLGAVFLLLASVIQESVFFSLMELVVVSGAVVAYSSFRVKARIIFTLLPALAVIGVLGFLNFLSAPMQQFGALSLIILSLGYALSSNFLFFASGIMLAWYSWVDYSNTSENLPIVFFSLNLIFAIISCVPDSVKGKEEDALNNA